MLNYYPESSSALDPYLLNKDFISIKVNPKTVVKSGFNCKTIQQLLKNIQTSQPATYQHSLNVARLSTSLAYKLCLTSEEIYNICVGALLHDIGKLYIPRSLLEKRSGFKSDEWSFIKRHPKSGVEIITQYQWGEPLESMILLHHERLDGKGYYGYKKDKIPLYARIITLSDSYDAMVSPRPYQKTKTINECWLELEKCGNTQFDTDLLPYFHAVIYNNPFQKSIIIT